MNIIEYPVLSNFGLIKIINPEFTDFNTLLHQNLNNRNGCVYRFTIPVGNLNEVDIREIMGRLREPLDIERMPWFPARDGIEWLPDDMWIPPPHSIRPIIDDADFGNIDFSNFNLNLIHRPQIKRKYSSYRCQTCGEPIGWLGRFFQWLPFKFLIHKCNFEFSNIN